MTKVQKRADELIDRLQEQLRMAVPTIAVRLYRDYPEGSAYREPDVVGFIVDLQLHVGAHGVLTIRQERGAARHTFDFFNSDEFITSGEDGGHPEVEGQYCIRSDDDFISIKF